MTGPLHLYRSRVELHARADDMAAFAYLRSVGVPPSSYAHALGAFTVTTVQTFPATGSLSLNASERFDFAEEGEPAFILEAFDADGETVMDLIGWPVAQPERVMSMFGTCAMLGAWQAFNPATYYFGQPLAMHRTPLDWLRAGCNGAAIVTPHLAARQLLDIPGRVAARDHEHGRALDALARSVIPSDKFLVPTERRAA